MGWDRRRALRQRVREFLPLIPDEDLEDIVERSLKAKPLGRMPPGTAAWLSAVAYIRHRYTEYDDLLQEGYDQEAARHFTAAAINEILASWGASRRVEP